MTTAAATTPWKPRPAIRKVPAPYTPAFKAAVKTIDHIETPIVAERGHMYAPRGNGMSFRSVNLPHRGRGWEIAGVGQPDLGAKQTLDVVTKRVLPAIAPDAWLLAGPGLIVNGIPSKGGVVQVMEKVDGKMKEVDLIVIDTTQSSEEMYESLMKAIWTLFEQQMAVQFNENFLEEVDESIRQTHNAAFQIGYREYGMLRTQAWLNWFSQHGLGEEGDLLEPDEDQRLPHESLFIDAMCGGLAAFLFDPDNRVPMLRA